MSEKPNGIVIQKKHIIIAIIIILLLLIGGVLLSANWNKWFGDKQPDISQSQAEDSSKPSLDSDPNAGEYTGEKPDDEGGEAVGIKIPGYHDRKGHDRCYYGTSQSRRQPLLLQVCDSAERHRRNDF